MRTKIITVAIILFASLLQLTAQDVNEKLKEASSAYQSGDLENARFALQEALNGINQAIGQDILNKLPEKMNDMGKVENSDNVSGTNMGFAGLYVSREYQGETADASFSIISDSPMIAGISSMLTMSVFMTTDPDQKKIKVDGYKALLTRNADDEGNVSFEIQLPFGSSLMTFSTDGISDEKTVVGMFEAIPVDEIVQIAQ
jgi:hypothetical protein